MKKLLVIISVLYFSNPSKAQSFFSESAIYLGIDLGFTGNSTLNDAAISSGIIRVRPLYFASAAREFAYTIGYARQQHAFELSYQVLRSALNYKYDEPYTDPLINSIVQDSNYDEEGLNYFVLRYYQDLNRKNRKWHLNVGGGIGIATFNSLTQSTLGKTSITTTYPTFTYDFVGDEVLYKKSTLCIEGNVKLQRLIGDHFVLQFWTRGILSPWYVRGLEFQITRSDKPNDPPVTGYVKSNMNSFGLGAGIQYRF